MKIKEKLSQYRRDFRAIYECEHCGYEEEGSGYDDTYFHQRVIPERKCPKCGKEVARIEDVGDVWLDAGVVPFSTLKYLEDKKYWGQWYPAEFVTEMIEQVRLWFYSMLFYG